MWTAGRAAKKIAKQPGAFALSVIKQFRANQGVLLAGAVAYYTLLSLVPLLILILMALSHVIPEDRLLLTLSEYLEFVVPGQSTAIVEEVRTFLAHKQVVGSILFVTMLFFSALAFTILENAMSVIFYHRVKIKRRHFLVSAVMPYLFILFLGVGLLIVTVLSGILQFVGTRSIMILGQPRSLDQVSIFLLYIVGVTGEIVTAHSNLFRHAGGTIVLPACAYRRRNCDNPLGNDASHSRVVLYDNVANPTRLRFTHYRNSRSIKCRDWGTSLIGRCPGDRGV